MVSLARHPQQLGSAPAPRCPLMKYTYGGVAVGAACRHARAGCVSRVPPPNRACMGRAGVRGLAAAALWWYVFCEPLSGSSGFRTGPLQYFFASVRICNCVCMGSGQRNRSPSLCVKSAVCCFVYFGVTSFPCSNSFHRLSVGYVPRVFKFFPTFLTQYRSRPSASAALWRRSSGSMPK